MKVFYSGGRGNAVPEVLVPGGIAAMMTWWDFIVSDTRRASNRYKEHQKKRSRKVK